MNQKDARKKLGPLLAIVQQHREFVSALLYNWMNDNRGIPGFLGGEAGVKQGGKMYTSVNGRAVWFTGLYNALKYRSNWKNPRYDTARAAGLALFLKRDFLHVTKSAAKALAQGLGNLGTQYVGILGEVEPAKVEVPPPTTPQGQEAAAQANVPAEDIDWAKIVPDVLGFIVSILPFLDGLMRSQDQVLPEGAAPVPGIGTQLATAIQSMPSLQPYVKPPVTALAPAPAPSPAQVEAAKPPMAVIAGGAVLGLGLVYLLTRKKKR